MHVPRMVDLSCNTGNVANSGYYSAIALCETYAEPPSHRYQKMNPATRSFCHMIRLWITHPCRNRGGRVAMAASGGGWEG